MQQEMKGGFVVETSYVGNRGTRLPANRNINATPAQYLSSSPNRDQAVTVLWDQSPVHRDHLES